MIRKSLVFRQFVFRLASIFKHIHLLCLALVIMRIYDRAILSRVSVYVGFEE